MTSSFSDLGVSEKLVVALRSCGFEHPSYVQQQALPLTLSSELPDVILQAKSGTGKTLVFLITILDNYCRALEANDDGDDVAGASLIVCPTREIAIQVSDECDKLLSALSKATAGGDGGCCFPKSVLRVIGGEEMQKKKNVIITNSCRMMLSIIVATPGRFIHMMKT
jgi:superfamily II DNA/RNA helicase